MGFQNTDMQISPRPRVKMGSTYMFERLLHPTEIPGTWTNKIPKLGSHKNGQETELSDNQLRN